MGYRVYVISPSHFMTFPCPGYGEIRLSLNAPLKMGAILKRVNAHAVHIATEGPLGWAARHWCLKNKFPFTTAYHTAFPEYLEARLPFKADKFYPLLCWFHKAGDGVFVATPTVRKLLESKGFNKIIPWSRGVDSDQFHAHVGTLNWKYPGPIQLYVGRVAVEKNIEAFLENNVGGTKIVVGDGPALGKLKTAYPDVHFLGPLFGQDLAKAYASADVFVFPSVTDTFGLVLIEALACGTPIAAYPVQGPVDVLGYDGCGPFAGWKEPIACLNDDISTAIKGALTLDREKCAQFALQYRWDTVARQFADSLSTQSLDSTALSLTTAAT